MNALADIRLIYTTVKRLSGEKRELDCPGRVVSMSYRFGGVGWWFICPLVGDGVPCGCRCGILCLGFGSVYFDRREYYELTCESRQKHQNRFYEGYIKPVQELDRINELSNRDVHPETQKLLRRAEKVRIAIENSTVNNKVPTKYEVAKPTRW